MIDEDFIIRYTNGLYSVDSTNAPSYNEFRDMFSSGQLKSKNWLVEELGNHLQLLHPAHLETLIVGSWYGTLGLMLKKKYPTMNVAMLDIDPRCKIFLDKITYNIPNIKAITGNMYDYIYDSSIVINTSCEHIISLKNWLSLIPKNTLVVLQSNNYASISDHINCVNNKDEFIEQANLSDVLYCGQLEMPMYTRFMIIGLT